MDKLIRQHQHCLNLDFPYLDQSGMVFCRDDEVDIDNGNGNGNDDDDNADSENTVTRILTIYQLLSDPRDYDLIKLARDADDPSIVHHTQSIFHAVMYMDAYHQDDEKGEVNPSSSSPSKAQSSTIYNPQKKEFARKIMSGEMNNEKTNELKLPFDLKLGNDDKNGDNNHHGNNSKSNSKLEIEKKYGSIAIDFGVFPENAIHTRLYIYWQVHIDDDDDDDDDDNDK